MLGTWQFIALGLTLGIHLLGAFGLFVLLRRGNGREQLHDGWDDDGGTPRDGPEPPAPGGGGGMPLADDEPWPVLLREPVGVADGHPAVVEHALASSPGSKRDRERHPAVAVLAPCRVRERLRVA